MAKAYLSYRCYWVNNAAKLDTHEFSLSSVTVHTRHYYPFLMEASCRTYANNLRNVTNQVHPQLIGSDDVPTKWCNCGIYGLATVKDMIAYERSILSRKPPGRPLVGVALAQWGKLIKHTGGLRSQYAQVMGIFRPTPDWVINPWDEKTIRQMEQAVEGKLPILPSAKLNDCWQDDGWVREWARERNLIPYTDEVEADAFVEDLENFAS